MVTSSQRQREPSGRNDCIQRDVCDIAWWAIEDDRGIFGARVESVEMNESLK